MLQAVVENPQTDLDYLSTYFDRDATWYRDDGQLWHSPTPAGRG